MSSHARGEYLYCMFFVLNRAPGGVVLQLRGDQEAGVWWETTG